LVPEGRGRHRVGGGEVRHDVAVAPPVDPARHVPGARVRVLDGASQGHPLGLGHAEQALAVEHHDPATSISCTVTGSPFRTVPGARPSSVFTSWSCTRTWLAEPGRR